MIGNALSPWHLILILLVALIFFGPDKLPGIAQGLGKAVNEFKKASSGWQQEFQEALKDDNDKVAASPVNEPEIKPPGTQI